MPHFRRAGEPPVTPPGIVVLQVRRPAGDTWHRFDSVNEAATFALELMRGVIDGNVYPLAIWRDGRKLWKPYGRHGKLHVASTRDALQSLSSGDTDIG
ncbi:MAG: hypothetical protein IT493_06155 [Gammaproteobacteria bacterium]|nr:hypothetical protein [Gammaproteobacteria bacterium]